MDGNALNQSTWKPLSTLQVTRKPLALMTAAMLLASCVATDRPPPSAGVVIPQTQAAMTGDSLEQREENPGQVAQEQQALINEINRDGSTLSLPGYREDAPQPVAVEGEDIVMLNYEQAELRTVLEELADALDLSMVIDPTISAKVSIRTAEDQPLRNADIWPLIRLLTREAGVSLERIGNIYHARPAPNALPHQITTADTDASGTVMQITPLTHISVASALEILTPLLEGSGQIVRISNNNTLAITASNSQLNRINELLEVVDTDPFQSQGIHLFPLENGNAGDVATELSEILAMIEGANPAYQVRAIDRINALLVTAPATRGFDEISRWVRILDADRQEQAEQLFHYRVKNLNAVELAATLTEVFSLDDEEDEDPVREDENDLNQNPVTDTFIDTDGTVRPQNEVQNVDAARAPAGAVAVSADLEVSIVADEPTNTLLIRANPRDYRQLLTAINQLDAVPLQVMINAVIAQITLNDETRFGVDWSRIANNADVDDISTNTSTSFLPAEGLGGLLFTKSFLDGAARVEATLEAIASNNEVRLLARPSLTVVNNMEGEIQIGSEVPVRSATSTTPSGETITSIQYRPTGIELYITPRINQDGVVYFTTATVLSDVQEGTGVDGNPVFENQEISTTVVVRNGENVVLGGLIQSSDGDLNTGVPGLSRIPVLGGLFSYQQDINERRELFIVLRPEILDLNDQSGVQYEAIRQRFELAAEIIDETVL